MKTPTAALAWEFWGRHQKRLLIVMGILAAFALFYPKLCASAGLDLNAPDILEEFAKKFGLNGHTGATPLLVVHILYLLFLACAPMVAMLLTLLFTAWLFTFTEFDARTRDPLVFPVRLFNLPVSTPFLYARLAGAGMAGMVLLFETWVRCVYLPHLEVFAPFQNCFVWMTLLAVTQGIVWGLAGWPLLRGIALAVLLWVFVMTPAWSIYLGWPYILAPLFLTGTIVAYAGLQNLRNGEWQGRVVRWPFAGWLNRGELSGPARFSSASSSQLWFEWRRMGRPMFLTVTALTLIPIIILILLRTAFAWEALDNDVIEGLSICFMVMPVLVYFLAGVSPAKSDAFFLLNRPIANGPIAMIRLKALAFSVALSWVVVLIALRGLALLGNFTAVEEKLSPYLSVRILFVAGAMFLTWRAAAASLCFVLTGRRKIAEIPIWLATIAILSGPMVSWISNQPEYWNPFLRILPGLLLCLVVLKLVLSLIGFRVSLQRRLVAPPAVAAYLAIWVLLVITGASSIILISHLDHSESSLRLWPLSLGIILIVPLARIGFCPVAISMNRHACSPWSIADCSYHA